MSEESTIIGNSAIAFGYVMAAAMSDAYALGKGEALKQRMLPLVKQFRKDGIVAPLAEAIRSELGEGWAPSGKFAEAIVKLHNG